MVAFTKKERIILLTLCSCLILGLGISAFQRYEDSRHLHSIEEGYAGLDASYRGVGNRHANNGQTNETVTAISAGVPDSLKLNVNTATATELEQLPRIGPVLAERIVEYRQEKGPFQKVEDLTKVKGIGEKTLERIRPYIYIRQTSGGKKFD